MSFLCLTSLKGQYIELSTETGPPLISAHEASNNLLKQSSYRAETFRLIFNGDTNKTYTKLYKGPSYGISLYSGTFHNQAIGDPLGLFFYIKTPLVNKKSFGAFTELGGGVVGNLTPYHEIYNPNNAMIGSQINMMGHIAIGIEYSITPPIKLGLTFGYKHFSNGFIKAPNYGINVIPITLIGSYNFSKSKSVFSSKGIKPFIPHDRISVFVGPGTKNYSSREQNYFVGTLGLQYIKQIGYRVGVGGGIDLFYKDSGKDKIKNRKSDFSNSLSSGINTSFEWIFTEKFRVNLGAGIYILRNKENDEVSPFYERLAAKYYITKNVFTGVGVKVNNNSSDYVEWTLGYTFMKDPNVYTLE